MSAATSRPAWPTAATRPVVLLGWPARHSLSPVLHNAAFAEQGLDLVYLAAPTPPEALAGVLDALRAIGAVGANVTVPHKEATLTACDELTEEARLIGAVNTLSWGPDGLVGDNTDARGFQHALTELVEVQPGDDLVVFGAGGAARAVVVAAGRLGLRCTIVARRPEAAGALTSVAARAGAPATGVVATHDEGAVRRAVTAARLVVNATPLGMRGERLPEPFHRLRSEQVAYDLIYTPLVTPFLADAAARGAVHDHGLGMLIGQAAVSYERWTARVAPVDTMTAAAHAALAATDRGA